MVTARVGCRVYMTFSPQERTPKMSQVLVRRVLVTLLAGLALLVAAIAVYGSHVRASATALINSARNIHSTVDANREIAAWRHQSGREFWKESDHVGGDHNYDAQIDNILLSRLRVFEPSAVTLGVTMRDGELRCITVIVSTGRKPSTTALVWVQEWFEGNRSSSLHVSDRGWKAVVEFPASAPAEQRAKAFALNAQCFVRPGGCKSALEILPTIRELEAPLSSNLRPTIIPID
jgi:hypothetical protein